jgi:hypothetical protein
MKKTAIATGALLLALADGAAAQPGLTPEPAPRPLAPVKPDDLKSEGLALALSVGGTVVSWGLLLGADHIAGDDGDQAELLGAAGALGVMLAPSFGHWYAGKILTRGLGLRGAGTLTVMIGGAVFLAECPLFSDEPCQPVWGRLLTIVGASLFAAGTVDDIIAAPRRVRRHNRELTELVITPVVTPHAAGLAFGGRF